MRTRRQWWREGEDGKCVAETGGDSDGGVIGVLGQAQGGLMGVRVSGGGGHHIRS